VQRLIPQTFLPLAVGLGLGLLVQSDFRPLPLASPLELGDEPFFLEVGTPPQHCTPQPNVDGVVPVHLVSRPTSPGDPGGQQFFLGSSRT